MIITENDFKWIKFACRELKLDFYNSILFIQKNLNSLKELLPRNISSEEITEIIILSLYSLLQDKERKSKMVI
jgi:hypothetical protein